MTESQAAEQLGQQILVGNMLKYQAYRPLAAFFKEAGYLNHPRLPLLIKLAQAYLDVNLEDIDHFAGRLQRQDLLSPSLLERRVYSYVHYLNLQFHRQEYMDYFRGMTPLLVDLLRLVIAQDFLPNINNYVQPIIKTTDDDRPLYRGLQWKQGLIEEGANPVNATFKKYYGNYFNYDHYVSSSHLLKLINDHSHNQRLIQLCDSLRHVEKYVRNIIAHEAVTVTPDFVLHRSGLSIAEIHQLIKELLLMAKLNDAKQWQVFQDINQEILEIIKEI